MNTVDRRSNISRKELIKEYVEPSIPVILTDAARDWKAIGKFTPEFFRNNYPNLSKEIKGVAYKMSDFINLMLNSTPEKPSPYPFSFNVERFFPELLADVKPEIVYGKCDRVNHPLLPRFMFHGTEVYEIFLGGNGSSFPFLHIDALLLHNQSTMVYGSKEFIMYSPDQIKYMYPKEGSPKYSQVNLSNPDYDKFPLFKEAQPIRVNLQEGETLIFPTGWWHTTQIHEPCISFGRIHLNAANWSRYVHEEYVVWKRRSSLMAISVLAYGQVLGKILNLQEKFI